MTGLEILKKARERISKPEHWCKRVVENYDEPKAYCAVGAVMASLDDTVDGSHAMNLLRDNLPTKAGGSIFYFNDHIDTTHSDVLALFDRTIASLEA